MNPMVAKTRTFRGLLAALGILLSTTCVVAAEAGPHGSRLRAGHGLVAGWAQEEATSPFPRVKLRLTLAGSYPEFVIAERRQLGWTDLGRIQPVGGA
jgi:hypothetical protein